ncbi:GntP family gluconate:H+ symporter [Pseudarthrobacter sp. W1I19]|uniref:GntP family permease n=1 Tax=Pseudarthrobacter sp. W1I19 TaxID=3042288 RepID=UPI00278A9BAC|nr:SLC13 family permease [Pseudarthrobacter sp. W1I19]MDQ0923869.1 GntP family gluconate:H+ symporter [Pseudarthrobacter sp. W1I19]
MEDWQILSITGAVIVGIVVMILRLRLNPAMSLVIGAAVLGLLTGLGAADTTKTLMTGFGDIMTKVGLLIAWGVLMGAILNEMGAISKLVDKLLHVFGPKGVPYALGLTIGTLLQSIFLDVLLVMSAPLARRIAPKLGKYGTAKIATAMAISLECGIVLMVPGVATVALAGLLQVPLGEMLIFGLLVIIPTIVVSIIIMNFFIHRGLWKTDTDEEQAVAESPALEDTDGMVVHTHVHAHGHEHGESAGPKSSHSSVQSTGTGAGLTSSRVGLLPHDVRTPETKTGREPGLLIMFGPMLLSLVLIASGAFLKMAGITMEITGFLSTPVVALLIGLLGTSLVARLTIGTKRVEAAVANGFKESGQILILTGAGGALAAMVATSGMGEILGKYFTASSVAPLLVVWAIAAVLHIAVGSVSISAITAAGLLAPIAPALGINPVLLALAAGAGSLFIVHVTSNTFWLLQSMLGQTTRGTLKSCTLGVSVASVVALGFTLVLSIFI